VQTDNISHLFFKMRIVGQLEALHPVRLHIVPLPDPVHHGAGDAQVFGKQAYAPVRTTVAGSRLQCRIEDFLLHFRRQNLGLTVPPVNSRYRRYPVLGNAARRAKTVGRDTFNCCAME
jgi:hypothetical protein